MDYYAMMYRSKFGESRSESGEEIDGDDKEVGGKSSAPSPASSSREEGQEKFRSIGIPLRS